MGLPTIKKNVSRLLGAMSSLQATLCAANASPGPGQKSSSHARDAVPGNECQMLQLGERDVMHKLCFPERLFDSGAFLSSPVEWTCSEASSVGWVVLPSPLYFGRCWSAHKMSRLGPDRGLDRGTESTSVHWPSLGLF